MFKQRWLQRGAFLTASAAMAAAVMTGCGGGHDDAAPSGPLTVPSVTELQASCTELTGQVIEGVRVTSTRRLEANGATVPAGICQVFGTRLPYLDIEVDLPDNWTGRYFQQGGGGFDGSIPSGIQASGSNPVVVSSLNPVLKDKGAIYAASNGGNRGNVSGQSAPAVWGDGTPAGAQSATDYSYASLGTTVQFAKAVALQVYKRKPIYSYFNGCSNGGKNAYAVAQRYASEFDGIVSGCETMDMGGQTTAWMAGAALPAASVITRAQSSAAYAAAVASCDAADGLADGQILKWESCHFDPAALQCGAPTASTDPAICLTAQQVTTLQTFLGDMRLSNGTTYYSGWSWASGVPNGYGGLGGGFMVLATGDPAWLTSTKQLTFNANTMYDSVKFGLLTIGADHDRNAIARYVASGKKLISWHGSADSLLSINDHVRNWKSMNATAAGLGLSDTRSATRFFVVPGVGHAVGSALTQVDWATAIFDWVEKGTAPIQLTYAFTSAGTAKSLPVCEYPQYVRYNGSGDVNSAASYTCTTP